jgi:sulfite reductase (NADPH) hemoprotein beta-component
MYQYDTLDQALVDQRVEQFRDQTRRFLAGTLSDDDFKPLRLQNGLYIQRYAPMLRVAVPYGVLSSKQLHALADISATFDKGYGHFTTRQNIQFNRIALEQAPDVLAALAKVQMHAIQTSGNCIRNTTCDHFAGVAADEVADPRPYAELIRQWSTLHPEFAFLPRKFKIAITASAVDRAAIRVHDIGLRLTKDAQGEPGFAVYIGGGLGRTPVVAPLIRGFVPEHQLQAYLEAALRVYNLYGRRDNLYKARIKILVRELGAEEFTQQVEQEFATALAAGAGSVQEHAAALARVSKAFHTPAYASLPDDPTELKAALATSPFFKQWHQRNVQAHRVPGYAAVTLSLKDSALPPGDATTAQMHAAAELAEQFSFGELRVTHHQNLVLPHVQKNRLPELYRLARAAKLAIGNVGLVTDMIACPGGDFCSLANAKSLPVAKAISQHLERLQLVEQVGDLELNISGCINACGHHHVGHIGLLGVDKAGEETFQLLIGGNQGPNATIGKILGRAIAIDELPFAVERLLRAYLAWRKDANERFIDVVNRLGTDPFKEEVYVQTA